MKKLKIITATFLAFATLNISAQANEEVISTAFYNFQEDFSAKDIYQNNIEFEKEGLCNDEGSFYKIVQKYDNKNKTGELYQCVDSKWIHKTDITDKIYESKIMIIKDQKEHTSFSTGIAEGDIAFANAQTKEKYVSFYNYKIKNNQTKETIKTDEIKTGINYLIHLFKDENNNLKVYTRLYISYLDDSPFSAHKNINPIKNIDYENTFNLKDFKDNRIEDTFLINNKTFDIQIKIKE